ncbi:hypothetical protein Tco_1403636 [Tanacetum coccineum]
MPLMSIWKALGGNTRDLDSIWGETRQDYNFTRSGYKNVCTVPKTYKIDLSQSGFKDARIVLGDGVAIPSDAIRTYKRWRQKLCDGVRT